MSSHHQHSPAREWPIDTDVEAEDIVRHDTPAHPHRPALDLKRLAVVVAGGFVGGLVRDQVVVHWATRFGDLPWSIFVVNTAGAFILGVLVIVVLDVLAGSHYLRPLVGAGFCGALTTFSSVAVAVDQLLHNGHALLGVGYLFGSLVAGLAAAALGAALGRILPPTTARSRLDGGQA